jgi:CRP-like cAMP-binding protein
VLLALLAEQIRRANERIVVAHFLDADARVRWALLQLVPAYEAAEDGTTIPLTQEQLAEIAGTTRPTVNRVLGDEERLQTVAVERGRVRVLSPEGLQQRVRGLPRL